MEPRSQLQAVEENLNDVHSSQGTLDLVFINFDLRFALCHLIELNNDFLLSSNSEFIMCSEKRWKIVYDPATYSIFFAFIRLIHSEIQKKFQHWIFHRRISFPIAINLHAIIINYASEGCVMIAHMTAHATVEPTRGRPEKIKNHIDDGINRPLPSVKWEKKAD